MGCNVTVNIGVHPSQAAEEETTMTGNCQCAGANFLLLFILGKDSLDASGLNCIAGKTQGCGMRMKLSKHTKNIF